jgi:5-methylcytosine-specific restriction enzyme subunit McrC
MLDMNVVFEAFVTRLVREALKDDPLLRCSAQKSLSAAIRDDVRERSYQSLRPDLILENLVAGDRVPVDIKYKLYERRRLSSPDIYQAFMYAVALDNSDVRRAGLIYPAEEPRSGPVLSVRDPNGSVQARIKAIALDVPAVLGALGTSHQVDVMTGLRSSLVEVMARLPE